jgi:hypothetical protein
MDKLTTPPPPSAIVKIATVRLVFSLAVARGWCLQ